MKKTNHHVYLWRNRWLVYQSILQTLHQYNELKNLTQWSKRKRLKVFQHYRCLLYETESQLFIKSQRDPVVYKWAQLAYHLNNLLTPKPAYYPRGYATKYRPN